MKHSFSKHVQKITSLINTAKEISYSNIDSIGLISQNISRPKLQSSRKSSKQRSSSIKSFTVQIKQYIPKQYQRFLQLLYQSKCSDLKIQKNDVNWRAFVKAFLSKNKKDDVIIPDQLNLSDFNLMESSMKHINKVLRENEAIIVLKLGKNLLNPNRIIRLQTIKELILNNCKLGNEALDQLFTKLHQSVVERISLSSPQIKNRNTLTRYDTLISLIRNSTTLHTLELSNIQIHPENQIMESCHSTTLRVLDLSDNTNVKGICTTIKSLNLSRNNIVYPFNMPLATFQIQYLNLSNNKIPYFHFKEFLKVIHFSRLEHLVLDHLNLSGDILSIQFFLQQSIRMTHISLVDCDLSLESYANITNGIKSSRSLKTVDLTRNRVFNEKVADLLNNMLQNSNIVQLKMRHCDIKDNLGRIIYKNIRKNKFIEKIDMMNNLLGDQTAKTICQQLKYTKNIICLQLQENIIKYRSMQQIMGFLQGNKYHNIRNLQNDYKKLSVLNKQVLQSEMIISNENERLSKLQRQTAKLQQQYLSKYKKENKAKKDKLINQIKSIRDQQNDIFNQISIRQSNVESSSPNNSSLANLEPALLN